MLATHDRRAWSLGVFGAFFLVTVGGLLWLYQWPIFGERSDRRVIVLAVVAMAATIWAGRSEAVALVESIVAPVRLHGRRAIALLSLASLAIGLAVARYVLDSFPNSGDELAFVLQAATYAEGRLWASPPPSMRRSVNCGLLTSATSG